MNVNYNNKDEKLENNLNDFFNNLTDSIEYTSLNSNNTLDIANDFSKYLKSGSIVVLIGELGSGKTLFVSGIAKYFNIKGDVSSPTFTIVNEYYGKDNNDTINIYHFDLYRLKNSDEFINSIGTEYFSKGICLIEWGEIIENILPKNTIYIHFVKDDEDENIRHLKISRRI